LTDVDEDLFTGQLDDLLGDIDDLSGVKAVPLVTNDDELLLEMQELLS
jgi:hypothetical protein